MNPWSSIPSRVGLRDGRRRAALVLFVTVAACARPEPPLRIGLLVYPGYEPAYFAQALGVLDTTQVRLVDFQTSADVTRAMQNGLIDATILTAFSGFRLMEVDSTIRAVMMPLYTNGADGFVGAPGVRSLRDVRGRKVATNPSASGMFFMMRALASVGMDLNDVQLTALDEGEQEDAVLSGRVASVQVYEPLYSRLLDRGAVNLFDSSRIPGEVPDFLLTPLAVIRDRRQSLRHFIDSWYIGRERMLADPRAAAARLAPREHVTSEAFLNMISRIEFPDRPTGMRLLADTGSMFRVAVRAHAAQLVEHGILRQLPDAARLIDTSFIQPPQ